MASNGANQFPVSTKVHGKLSASLTIVNVRDKKLCSTVFYKFTSSQPYGIDGFDCRVWYKLKSAENGMSKTSQDPDPDRKWEEENVHRLGEASKSSSRVMNCYGQKARSLSALHLGRLGRLGRIQALWLLGNFNVHTMADNSSWPWFVTR